MTLVIRVALAAAGDEKTPGPAGFGIVCQEDGGSRRGEFATPMTHATLGQAVRAAAGIVAQMCGGYSPRDDVKRLHETSGPLYERALELARAAQEKVRDGWDAT